VACFNPNTRPMLKTAIMLNEPIFSNISAVTVLLRAYLLYPCRQSQRVRLCSNETYG
jgi:hypothetical protein